MSETAERAAEAILSVAADPAAGYDQARRWGPDYDCSSLVIAAWKRAGVPLRCTWTGDMYADMTARGFRDVTGEVNLHTGAGLERGDVLLNHRCHTALYLGGGNMAEATGNEAGGVTGGRSGDQTGREIAVNPYRNFVWDCVLRYTEPEPARAAGQGAYTVREGDSLWAIAARELGDALRWPEIAAWNALPSERIYPGQRLRLGPEEKKTCPVCGQEIRGGGGAGAGRP